MRKYSISLITSVLLLLICVAIFNWLIDPYGVFGSPDIKGLNEYKIEANRHTRLGKAYQVKKIKPEVIFLASSRGLVVPESYFSNENEVALNLSLASGSTYELFRYFQHANAVKPLKRVVLALDEFFTYTLQPEFSEERLKVDVDGHINTAKRDKVLRDMVNNLISLDALKSSLRTVRKQDESPESLSEEKYMHKRVAGAGGHRQMFRKMEASLFSQNLHFDNCSKNNSSGCEEKVQSRQYFERLVDTAYRDNIELIIYFSPVHARYLEVLNIMGKWNDIEDMKRFVVQTISSKAKKYSKTAFTVWGFSGYSRITTENLPDFNDTTSIMDGYWEGSHYTNKTAKLIFDVMFASNASRDELGEKVNVMNIEKHLDAIRRQRNKYIDEHKDYEDELKSLGLLNMLQK